MAEREELYLSSIEEVSRVQRAKQVNKTGHPENGGVICPKTRQEKQNASTLLNAQSLGGKEERKRQKIPSLWTEGRNPLYGESRDLHPALHEERSPKSGEKGK